VEGPFIRIEDNGAALPLRAGVTTVGRGKGTDIRIDDPSVSRLHAEIVRRGPYFYVVDLGLSRNGTRVNGQPISRHLLDDGDVVTFGAARCRMGGIPKEVADPDVDVRTAAPDLTRRELDVLTALCRPALSDEAFVAPASAVQVGEELVITEAAVKQHLIRLYRKFRIEAGPNRRARLANEVIAMGLVRPLPPATPQPPPHAQPRQEPTGGPHP
jgi:predicted component of type VI protein secretion system